MIEQSRLNIELFLANMQKMRRAFVWKSVMIKRLTALLYTAKQQVVDLDAIRSCSVLIQENTSLFSVFRGNTAMSIAAMLSLHENPHRQLAETITVYHLMKARRFRSSDYLVLAAYQIANHASEEQYDALIDRAQAFYAGLKTSHPYVIGQNHYLYAAMLALSNWTVQSGLKKIEQFHQTLKPSFRSRKGVITLAQVLVLCGADDYSERRVIDLYQQFRQHRLKVNQTNSLSSLGVLSALSTEVSELVEAISEAYTALRQQKGFGCCSVAKQELLLLSASLVALSHVDEKEGRVLEASVTTSLIELLIMQQTAIYAAVASSAAIAASNS